jgi:hypothetical protein
MSHRLWFRLDDVLPLAEHAMACTTHRITSAQTLALAPTVPALVWTGSPLMDILVSNGMPAWYGERGTDHAAVAYTWRHTVACTWRTTRRYGTAWRNGYDTAYLPLDVASNEPTVIDVLRDAWHTDRHWITVDIDHTDAHLIRPSLVHAVTHRDHLVPADAAWVEATVTSTAVAGAGYPALIAEGYTTDAGSEVPRFDRPTAERMIADIDAIHTTDALPGRYPHLRLVGDVLLVIEEHNNGERSTYRQIDVVHPDAQGRYAVGAYIWAWQRATK